MAQIFQFVWIAVVVGHCINTHVNHCCVCSGTELVKRFSQKDWRCFWRRELTCVTDISIVSVLLLLLDIE